MKVVAMCGYPGSGKTYVSRYLLRTTEGIYYLSVDNFTTSHKGLKTQRNYILRLLLDGKRDHELDEKRHEFNEQLTNSLLKEIERIKQEENVKLIIVDYAKMLSLKDLMPIFDYIVLVRRPDEARYNGIVSRRGHSGGKEMAKKLKPFAKRYCHQPKDEDCDYIIENVGDDKDILKNIDKIFDEIMN